MNEHLEPEILNPCVVKLSDSLAHACLTWACVPHPDLNGPTLDHFESNSDAPRLNQRFLNLFESVE